MIDGFPPPRNEVFDALMALATAQLFDGQPFVTMSRKFQHFSKVDAANQPALYQTEPTERISQKTGLLSKRFWYANWTIYFTSDAANLEDVPAIRMNTFIDQMEAVFPSDDPDQKQTLGGLVEHVFIDGDVLKVAGDDDGQGLIVLPITILVP